MLKSQETAERVDELLRQAVAALNQSIWVAQEAEGREETRDYRLAVGYVMAEIHNSLLSRIYRDFPALEPEELRAAFRPAGREPGDGAA